MLHIGTIGCKAGATDCDVRQDLFVKMPFNNRMSMKLQGASSVV